MGIQRRNALPLALVAALLALSSGPAVAAQDDPALVSRWTTEAFGEGKLRLAVEVRMEAGDLVLPVGSEVEDELGSLFALQGSGNAQGWSAVVTRVGTVSRDDTDDGIHVLSFSLLVVEPLEEGMRYRVVVQRALELTEEGQQPVSVEAGPLEPLTDENRQWNEDYITPRTRVDRIEISGGDAGTLSFHLRRGLNQLSAKSWLHFEVEAYGDVTLNAAERSAYYDNLTAELRGYGAFFYDLGDRERYADLGLHYRIESDQELDAIDQVIGVSLRTYTQDPLSAFLADVFRPEKQAIVTPLLGLELNWVDELEQGDQSQAAAKPDTAGGVWRAEGFLDWRLPLGRDLEWTFLPAIGVVQDLDLLFELRGVQDLDENDWYDRSRITLRFSPEPNEDGSHAAFELTWASGQSAPLFEDIQAFLVGLQLSR